VRIALIVPGGVDRSAEHRVIPALLGLIARLSADHEVQVFALHQEKRPGEWQLAGAQVINIGVRHTWRRTVQAICKRHRSTPFDVVHAIWSGTCGMLAVVTAKLIGRPSVIHVAGGELVSLPDIAYGGMQNWRGRLREPWVLRAASAVTAASSPVIDSLAKLGVTAHRIPLGVDCSTWPARAPVSREANRKVRLIHIASLNRVKDQPTMLRALAALAKTGVEFEMDIAGEDTLGGEIQTMAEQMGLSTMIRFLGFLTQRELRPFVEASDLLVMSSRHETGPLVMLEAAVVGVPTVGTAVGHIAEWAPDAAIAVPTGNWVELGRKIGQLVENEGLRLRMALLAQERALREDVDYTARQFVSLYSSLR
jgi:glycosyltransferase involved in cell wall biosynthesis